MTLSREIDSVNTKYKLPTENVGGRANEQATKRLAERASMHNQQDTEETSHEVIGVFEAPKQRYMRKVKWDHVMTR